MDILYKCTAGRCWYPALLGNMFANCRRQVASALTTCSIKLALPGLPSGAASPPRQGPPQSLITTLALLPRCRQLSLFLSNVTQGCVTMATAGHRFEECNREKRERKKKSHGLDGSWSRATSEVANRLLPILRRGRLRNGRKLPLLPGKEEQTGNKTWWPRPAQGTVLPFWCGARGAISQASIVKHRNKHTTERGVLSYPVDEPRDP